MKKILLLMMCCPMMLAAQNGNGVTVSNLNVNAGTVTFNVSWKNTGMPTLWSDSVWVFVDYNNGAGKMERLPLSGATLTAPSWSDATVIFSKDGNKQGAWVVGNARTRSSFSATVQLLTEAANLSGVCAYASNYPPVGEYQNPTQIKFIGTPIYKIVVEETGGGTLTDYSDGSYTMRDGYTIQSFTDATGAPGKMNCMLPATYTLNVSALSFCADSEGVQFALSGTEDGRHYQLYRDGVAVDGAVLAGTGDAGTFGTFSEAGTYTAQTITDEKYCAIAMNGTHIIAAYPAFTAGEIATSSTTTPAGTNPNVTVESLSPTLGGSGNTTYLWLRTGTSSATLTDNGVATYMIGSGDYSAAGTHYFNRYAKDATCNTDWVAAAGTYTLMVEFNGVNQPQGQCTFTQPPVVGTFANFDPDYSASTFVTLTDERDCNNYTVVKIGGRWIMGQNLNYQKGLTYFNTHATPSKDIHSNPALRGGFWCPSNSSGTISVTACDYWGALYAWETAMTLDGKDTWTYTGEFGDCYDALNSAACKQNHGRSTSDGLTSGGRGICPPNWHVPTAYEWGVLWDAMEETPSTVISNSSGGQWWGTSAGDRAKAACAECTDAPNNCWDSKGGSDAFNFRVLPACVRDWQGEAGTCIGTTAVFFSSSFSKWGANSACFVMNNIENGVLWSYMNLSQGNSVRCIRN